MMAEGVVVAASAGENATASFWREPLLCGSHAFAGGTPLRGAKPCVLGFCVRGVSCVGNGVSSFFANLHLGLGGGGLQVTSSACRGPAVHWLGVSRACGPLARRSAGRRSTQARPRFGGVSKKRKQTLQDPALAGSPRKASFLPFHNNKY